jgi:hypothetical protein
VDTPDELLEEPLFLDGIAIRRWSDLARLPRPERFDGSERARHHLPGSGTVPSPREMPVRSAGSSSARADS